MLMAGMAMQIMFASSAAADLECGQYPFDDNSELAGTYEVISSTVAPFAGLSETLNSKVKLCLSDSLVEARGYYEPDGRKLVLARNLPSGLLLAVAIHELRHVQQFDTRSCPSVDLSMGEYVQGVFAMEADASVTSLVVAAWLREQGNDAMWEALADWPMQSDLALSFDTELAKSSDIGLAASAAFSAWYENAERLENYYISICSNYLDQIDRDHVLPRYNSLSDQFFVDLCRLPDGQAYDCRSPKPMP